MVAFAFEAAKEIFGNGVIIWIAFAGHALADIKIGEALTVSTGGILDAAAGVEMRPRRGLRRCTALSRAVRVRF